MVNPEQVREIGKQSKRKRREQNREHLREVDKRSFRKRKAENPEHVRQIERETKRKRKEQNPEHVREIDKQSFRKRKADKPQHIRQINGSTKVARRKIVDDLKITLLAAEMQCENVQHQVLTATDNGELQGQQHKHNVISMVNVFHNDIKRGPEYICTCCDQLWYKSSVVKCDGNKYKTCSPNLLEYCLTGLRSVDNFEWICTACDSNLKKGMLPSCSKADKMTFADKPELLNLTPLEERLVLPRIPRAINESQTISNKTKKTSQL